MCRGWLIFIAAAGTSPFDAVHAGVTRRAIPADVAWPSWRALRSLVLFVLLLLLGVEQTGENLVARL